MAAHRAEKQSDERREIFLAHNECINDKDLQSSNIKHNKTFFLHRWEQERERETDDLPIVKPT